MFAEEIYIEKKYKGSILSIYKSCSQRYYTLYFDKKIVHEAAFDNIEEAFRYLKHLKRSSLN